MNRHETYNTKQKNLILEIIKKQKKEFTVKNIYNEISKKIGLTTIYRLVDRLVLDGTLKKFIGDNNSTYYQYLEKCNETNHFYLKCEVCKKMIHIDCDCIEDLTNHITKQHMFMPNKENIIINGICNECLNNGGNLC